MFWDQGIRAFRNPWDLSLFDATAGCKACLVFKMGWVMGPLQMAENRWVTGVLALLVGVITPFYNIL